MLLRCPFCRTGDTRVVDSRELSGGDSIRRRRACEACNRRFTTYERVESVSLTVVKKDGRREPFSQDKLRQKIRVALTKRPISEDTLDTIVGRVESVVMQLGTKEVTSTQIGEAVLRELKATDQVAYIRFASVYRQFADLEDLRREVEGLASPSDGRSVGQGTGS
ncbi:MAG: transcriptional regulator NrdR [Thermomicrobiales bacterium]